MILVIDNYDSFVHNLARYFRQLGCETVVVRNDQIDVDQVKKLSPQAIVLSPGPCTPDLAGCSIELVKTFAGQIPILGICLGHQAIVEALGGTIVLANEPVHGRQSSVLHTGSKMFTGIRSPFIAGRYHSLVAKHDNLPAALRVTAKTEDGTIMAVEHHDWPTVGIQFHPESILTQCGYQLLINFLSIAGIDVPIPECFNELPKGQWGNAYPLVDEPVLSSRLTKQESP
jgi:anthranilate synthase/aminodeoxychorismate synthase-like glutamine amidotransferase